MAFSLLGGTLFLPLQAEASFFSALFNGGQVADANTRQSDSDTDINTVTPPDFHNPQSIQSPDWSLQAKVAPVNRESKKNDQNSPVDPKATVTIADNAIVPGSTSASGGATADVAVPPASDTSVYVVRQGDAISQIADMFGVSVNTILWANNMKKGDKLNAGDVLLILPVSGVEHTVTKGQTIQSIAKLYKVGVDDIIQNNDITLSTPLVVGDTLIIPNGEKSQENDKPLPAKDLATTIAKDKQYYTQHPVQNLAGYFIDPVPGYRLSQGIHDRNAVDLAISIGTPIHAAAAGVVLLARTGYNGGFGNVVIINHPNGTQTVYAHQSKLNTTTGAQVYQGQIIGYVGSTGHSTGPHLHFEVHGAQNPGANDSWKY